MILFASRWWRFAALAGATTSLLLTTGCGAQSPTTSRCAPLPASDVPPMQKALTQSDTGRYCATPGTTILIVLKAKDYSPSSTWAQPAWAGPDGGARWISPPLTPLRGSTVAAIALTAQGTYRLTSNAGSATWLVTVTVSSK
ncbi:MAG: hypothetical protein ACTHJM_04000 [Marmoricola sp.]